MDGDNTTSVAVVATGDAGVAASVAQALQAGGIEGVSVVTDASDMFAPQAGEGQPIPASIQGIVDMSPRMSLKHDDQVFSLDAFRPELRVKRHHPLGILPQYQTKGAAAFDLHAIIEAKDESPPGTGITIPVGQARTFRTGFAYEVPDGWVMKIYSRSGHGFKNGVVLANGTGVIDSDYRGEIVVRLRNEGDFPFTVHHGDRVGQACIEQAMQWELVEIPDGEELNVTDRGEGGFGSTGR